ncbi:MAG: cytochrome b [Kordiimonadaceae bacterium]|jgi:cytochrome b561|nr:cytochrome b [Kordiimonadaceae bacterium]MBT6033527.1 cytochrome b [Kordiimonadaceae bacterium]
MKRYHPLIIALHWIVAIMVLISLLLGGPGLAEMDSNDPDKLSGAMGHMIWGLVVGFFMVVRLITRVNTQNPTKADSGNNLINLGARAAHWCLYLLVLAMVATGLGTAISANLFEIIFGASGQPFPADIKQFLPMAAHGIIATLLVILIGLHVLGWAYHQFILRDGLLSRMWFGKRKVD